MLGITYQYSEGANSGSVVKQTGGAAPASDLVLSWTDAAIKRLQAHPWPGNVRELENTIERLGILCEGGRPVTLERVEQALGDSASTLPSRRETFIDEERDRYERLLTDNRWNVSAFPLASTR